MRLRLLIVEDEPAIAGHLADSVREAGYAVDCAGDGERADYLAHSERYDAIVLDLGLPKVDGLTLLRSWREAGIRSPILILTARGSWHEKVQGMDAGADDYVGKPFRTEEVLARIRALIRRASGNLQSELRSGSITLDTRTTEVTRGELRVSLTSHEFRLLSYLMHHGGRVVGKTELTEHIYAQDFDRDSNTIEVFVARLRRKLGSEAIRTVRGIGYQMGAPE